MRSIFFSYYCYYEQSMVEFLRYLGLHTSHILEAVFIPIIIVVGLFIGPLVMRQLEVIIYCVLGKFFY